MKILNSWMCIWYIISNVVFPLYFQMNSLFNVTVCFVVLVATVSSFTIERQTDEQQSENGESTDHTMLSGVISKLLSIKKRSVGTGTVEYSMGSDTDSTIPWHTVNETVNQQSFMSKLALGSTAGEIPVVDCNAGVSSGINDPIHKRSTCPWYYEVDHDATRFPTTKLRAVRACDTCIGSGNTFQCIAITQNETVLRKSTQLDVNNNFVWVESEETVTVGFTCAGRKFAENIANTETSSSSSEQATTPYYE